MKLKVENGIIEDGAFVGDGCAISQASADIMLGMIVGKTEEEALKLGKLFLKMIQGEATDEEIDELEEASALKRHFPYACPCKMRSPWLAYPEGSIKKINENSYCHMSDDIDSSCFKVFSYSRCVTSNCFL